MLAKPEEFGGGTPCPALIKNLSADENILCRLLGGGFQAEVEG